jgi:hypothetical protein
VHGKVILNFYIKREPPHSAWYFLRGKHPTKSIIRYSNFLILVLIYFPDFGTLKYIAVKERVRTTGVWGRCPYAGVPPLHPVLSNPLVAITFIKLWVLKTPLYS